MYFGFCRLYFWGDGHVRAMALPSYIGKYHVRFNLIMKRIDFKQWKKYKDSIFLLMRGNLSDWDKGFICSINKQLGNLSPKQIAVLERILCTNFSQKFSNQK